MRNRKGFTLIELMVVILIVAILAAILVPIMRGRLDAAKWSEGKAGCGTIASSLRAYCVERGNTLVAVAIDPIADLKFLAPDLTGRYFIATDYSIGPVSYDNATGVFSYLITCRSSDADPSGGPVTLDQNGTWTGP